MTSNRRASAVFRDSVLLALHEAGLYSAQSFKFSGTPGPELPGSSNVITGTNWGLLTRVDRGPISFSEAVRDSRRFTEFLGVSRSAVVMPRRGHPTLQAYVVTELRDFATVLHADAATRRTA